MFFDWFKNISLLDEILLGVFLLLWFYELYFWLRYMRGIIRWRIRAKKAESKKISEPVGEDAGTEELCTVDFTPAVSVVVCARNERVNLSDYLPILLSQNYPEYEVIVVDDGSVDDTRIVVERLKRRYNNLRLTFIPADAWVTSSKKLALTLAAKAARYDYLLLTDADCRPESMNWIKEMMSGFATGAEVVLGFGAYFEKEGCLNRFIEYDTLSSGMLFLGMAAAGRPYMGVGRNLAYRKDTFFNNNGFAGLLYNKAGDDDLFVNKVAKGDNTAIVASAESVTWSVPKTSFKEWLQQKRRHLSVSPRYKMSSKFLLSVEPLSRAMLYGLLIAVSILCPWYMAVGMGVFMLARLTWQITIINQTAHGFGLRGFGLSVLFFDIFFPVFTLCIMIRNAVLPQRTRW